MKKIVLPVTLLFFLLLINYTFSFGINHTDTRMLTQPAISTDYIAFIYAERVWIANTDGSDPRRLTNNEGTESNPMFSPDGKQIAFTGKYNGNTDVYIMSTGLTAGKKYVPKRLTNQHYAGA